METLIAFLNNMSPAQQVEFATRCKTSVGYLRKAASVGQQLGDGLCLRIGAESHGAVSPESLRPDIDWGYLRKALAVPAQAATENVAVAANA